MAMPPDSASGFAGLANRQMGMREAADIGLDGHGMEPHEFEASGCGHADAVLAPAAEGLEKRRIADGGHFMALLLRSMLPSSSCGCRFIAGIRTPE